MNLFEKTNKMLEEYIDSDYIKDEKAVTEFKQNLVQALSKQFEIIEKRGGYEHSICDIKINAPEDKLAEINKALDDNYCDTMENPLLFTIHCKHITRYRLPKEPVLYATLEIAGYDQNEQLTYLDVETANIHVDNRSFDDVATEIKEEIDNLINYFDEDYFAHPDWDEITADNEASAREDAEIARWEAQRGY